MALPKPLWIDPHHDDTWQGNKRLELSPLLCKLLRHLVTHRDLVVSKEELVSTVWSDAAVSDYVISTAIRRLRSALGDIDKPHQYIQTFARRGYQFTGPLQLRPADRPNDSGFTPPAHLPVADLPPSGESPLVMHLCVGREAELALLQQRLNDAPGRPPHVVFVTGEPGIGKTTLVNAFVQQVAREDQVYVAHGLCIEHYGPGEAYLPVLTALDRWCREPMGPSIIDKLRESAPTWLVQLTTAISGSERATLQGQLGHNGHQRMLREFGTFLLALTAQRPLLLVVEDVHWSDPSTLDLLSFVARHSDLTGVLIVATYRPADVEGNGHPVPALQQEFIGQGLGNEIALAGLRLPAIEEYVRQRFTQSVFPTALPQALFLRTEGNPLFLVAMIDELVAQGLLGTEEHAPASSLLALPTSGDLPERMRQLLTRQMERLSVQEQRVLAAASVSGLEFSAVEVVAALAMEQVEVEQYCTGLVRRQLLRRAGIREWPDGTLTARYGFQHAVYQYLWQERVTPTEWQRMHQRIGERKEAGYGARAGEIAAELAVHFEQGRDYPRTIQYLRLAGENAIRRYATREALAHLRKGLAFVTEIPEPNAQRRSERQVLTTLGPLLLEANGYAHVEVGERFQRLQELSDSGEEAGQEFSTTWGLWVHYFVRCEFKEAQEIGEQFLQDAEQRSNPVLILKAHEMLGPMWFHIGNFARARHHLAQASALYDRQEHRALALIYGQDPGVAPFSYAAFCLWFLGYPEQAAQWRAQARAVIQETSHPYSRVFAFVHEAGFQQCAREDVAMEVAAQEAIAIDAEHGFAQQGSEALCLHGLALCKRGAGEEGMGELLRGLEVFRATGALLEIPHILSMVAEGYAILGQFDAALETVTEALQTIEQTGERYYESEIRRLQGEMLLGHSSAEGVDRERDAEQCFLRAIAVAQKQQAKSLELRASTSLARLWQRLGKKKQAHKMLVEIYTWFTEGFNTKDLQEAKTLLHRLAPK